MYRKFKANSIFNGRQFVPGGQVLVTEADGTITAIVDEAIAGDDIEQLDGILCPGFINAHCHIELSHLKNRIPQHTGLVGFVQQVMSGREAGIAEKQAAMENAVRELYDSGTVAVGDICNTADSISIKKNTPLYWHNFIEVSGFTAAGAEKRLAAALDILDAFKAALPCRSILSPHAPYSVSSALFKLLNAATGGRLISIHNQETLAEDELYLCKLGGFLELYKNFGIDISGFKATGRSSMQSWRGYFNNRQRIISVHNTFTSQADLDFLQNNNALHDIYFCLCPNANRYIENALPPVKLFTENNLPGNIVLGTDSYAGNTQLNMLEEIKTIRQYFPSVPLENILQWATWNGAKALDIDTHFGSFTTGKKPGIVLINNTNGMENAAAKRIG